jgi:xanthine dehydrogenase accessory factor
VSDAPVAAGAPLATVLQRLATACAEGAPAVLATVIRRKGSAPATPGQKLLLLDEGVCLGTLGGGALERAVLDDLQAMLERARDGTSEVARRDFALAASLGMCCGGSVEVMMESFAAPWCVGIVGAGHVAAALAPVLSPLGFQVHVADERDEFATPARFPTATVHPGGYTDLAAHVPARGALLVMTHDHALDQDAIAWALRQGFAFVGGVGSRAKLARCRARLEARGFTDTELSRVRMPLGVEVRARTPEEIAVAIAAELIAWRRGAPPGPR